MQPREWLDSFAEAVSGRIRDVDVRNIDADTMTLAHGEVVCIVHVLTSYTASFLVSRSGNGAGAARVEHGEPRIEVMDDLSLGTLSALVAGWLRSTE